MSKEHNLQNEIRNALAGECLLFRANVGSAWTGSKMDKLPGGKMLIHDARPFNTGLPPGFSDLFGLVAVTITPDMVGQTVGVFFAPEVKTATGRLSDKQANFLNAVNDNGGRAGVVRSVEDARELMRRKPTVKFCCAGGPQWGHAYDCPELP